MKNENNKQKNTPLYWTPDVLQQKKQAQSLNTAILKLFESGLWNIPKEYIQNKFPYISKFNYESLEIMHKNKKLSYISATHIELDRIFIILNNSRTLSEDTPQECTFYVAEQLLEYFGDLASNFVKKITFSYAEFEDVINNYDFFSPLVDTDYTFNVTKNKKPWVIECYDWFEDGGEVSWGGSSKCCIFMSDQTVTELSNTFSIETPSTLLQGDAIRAALPELEQNILIDVNKGHWDLYQPPEISEDISAYHLTPTAETFIARNPLRDVQSNSLVSIDFGTSSTVVAIRNEDRSIMLQRIGMQSPTQKVEAKHFQNPTVLEFLNYTSFMERWTAVPYRPLTRWADVCCSHKAKNEICSTKVDAKAINSGLASLKTWARRKKADTALRLRDQQGVEITLPSLTTHNNHGRISEDFTNENLNPIELYAYFIGLNLNNQAYYGGRIFQEYYLTFPIKFDRATRDGILYSFRRGLMRSLPPALAYTPDWIENNFIVEESASEPTAYAAAALGEIQEIQATADGVAFGVFDFGGGTTDFSFGLYRLATASEAEDDGYEVVLDILDTAGDENLGGEHLLQGMTTCIIEKNIDILLEKNISFTFPPHTHFHGQEALMDFGSIAYCNTTILNEELRPLWEEGVLDDDNSGTMSFTFFNKANESAENIVLTINTEDLEGYLVERISKGVRAFFTAYAQAFKRENILHPDKFHVLLAGNSCRSPFVQEAFNRVLDEIKSQDAAFEEIRDAIILHPPLQANENDFNKPTMKTGVALGLLKIAPGESLGVVERLHSAEESPFRYSVGRFVSGILSPTLERNSSYGQWCELGKVRTNGMDVIGFSLLPEALEGKVAQDNCLCLRHKWDKKYAGRKILIQAHAPDTIALALANEDNAPDESTISYYPLA